MTTPSIETIQLGKTDVRVPPLGIGTWSWGDSMIWGYGKSYTESDVKTAFDASVAAGINFFDTAEMYGLGKSERLLGRFIRESEEQPFVATKFVPLPWRLPKGALITALRKSLARLGLAQVGLYQIHLPFPPRPVDFWVDGLANAALSGLARAVGISNCSADQTRRAAAILGGRGVFLASNQVEYSLLHRDPERNGLLQACADLGVTLIAYSPLAMGMLTGKYTSTNPPAGVRGGRYRGQYLAKIQPLIGILREIGAAHGGKSPSQVALNWVISKGAIPIPGAKNARQAKENAGALGWRLTADEVAALDRASDAIR